MSLGSIAHMQYYFSKTGLLDGKGAQMAREDDASDDDGYDAQTRCKHDSKMGSEAGDFVELDDADEVMLPPTISTYRPKPIIVYTLPEIRTMRASLTRSFASLSSALDDADDCPSSDRTSQRAVLDRAEEAVRTAKNYYNCHDPTSTLFTIVAEKDLRNALYDVMAAANDLDSTNFARRASERAKVREWIRMVAGLLEYEDQEETRLMEQRRSYTWLRGIWSGQERQREQAFLQCFVNNKTVLPDWTGSPIEGKPTAFLRAMQNGKMLVALHNELVLRSEKHFGFITNQHNDISKPYRQADNLRYWIKAAELRWGVKLELDVMNLVYERDENVWQDFDACIMEWSKAVRAEISTAWLDENSFAVRSSRHLQHS